MPWNDYSLLSHKVFPVCQKVKFSNGDKKKNMSLPALFKPSNKRERLRKWHTEILAVHRVSLKVYNAFTVPGGVAYVPYDRPYLIMKWPKKKKKTVSHWSDEHPD